MSDRVERGPFYRRIFAALGRIEDGTILRFAFFAMLIGTASVLYVDFRERAATDLPVFATPMSPLLPAIDPNSPTFGPTPELSTAWSELEQPVTVTLTAGGVLDMTGTIDVGAFDRFMAEIDARGEYIKTVSLNSPGGSVNDAIAIGAVIRDRGLSTSVAAGALCASSCPLIFASGIERLATATSAIGVHQIYETAPTAELSKALRDPGTAMSEAQKTTAMIARHLNFMGIDPEMWLHALETPPQSLYYFSPEEMTGLKLVTQLQS